MTKSIELTNQEQPDFTQLRDRMVALWSTYQQSPNRYTDTLGLLPEAHPGYRAGHPRLHSRRRGAATHAGGITK